MNCGPLILVPSQELFVTYYRYFSAFLRFSLFTSSYISCLWVIAAVVNRLILPSVCSYSNPSIRILGLFIVFSWLFFVCWTPTI